MAKIQLSPRPAKVRADLVFPDAILAVVQGMRISRVEWKDVEIYGLMAQGFLMLHKADGMHQWIVNDGDLLAEDWFVVEPELN